MYNTLKQLKILHELGYLYRDVKPANFMLQKIRE
jgi:serine/threonine protein kinase